MPAITVMNSIHVNVNPVDVSHLIKKSCFMLEKL